MAVSTDDDEAREKVWDMVKDIKIAMLATQGMDGRLFARPMASQARDKQGRLWFFASLDSPKTEEIERFSNVLLSYAAPEKNEYISMSGEAEIVRDPEMIERLWHESLKVWFPEGKDDPNLTLICVEPVSAEYWDAPSGVFVQAFGYLKAKMTGRQDEAGENKIVRM